MFLTIYHFFIRFWALSLLLSLTVFFGGCSQDPSTESGSKNPPEKSAPTNPTNQSTLGQTPPANQTDQGALGSSSPIAQDDPDSDSPVALVNGQPISINSLNGQVSMRLYAFDQSDQPKNPLNPPIELRLEVLDQLISLELAYQAAHKAGYEPNSAEIDQVVNQIAANYGGDLGELEKTLKSFGDSLDRLKKQVAYNETIKKWRDTAFLAQAMVSDSEAKAFFDERESETERPDQILALQIIFPVPLMPSGDPTAIRETIREKAAAALKEAKAGVKFEALIQKYMDKNALNITNEGQMGWVAQDGAFPELEEALFKLKPGQVSEVVETPYSFHILKAIEFRAAGRFAFEDVRPDIVDFLTNQKIDLAVRDQIEALRAQAKIVVNDPELAKAWPGFLETQKTKAATAEEAKATAAKEPKDAAAEKAKATAAEKAKAAAAEKAKATDPKKAKDGQ
ncbi:MAG: peptidyl-prolyl cis-trans isomerase [Deltaproteobacteria bacterium]|jgi:peptidyl-prolyl cis-trans isomerase C|nr:peptidyl-prolyl cis-trans isomerase [Deltaproteobacteria bacterium]